MASSGGNIISISRRTDIPAFYSRWLMNRIRAGYCHVLHPFAGTLNRVSLSPEDCAALVFWTRNPRPMIRHLPVLDRMGYRYYFHVTLNGYPPTVESHNPPLASALDAVLRLAECVGPERIIWRYDPILTADELSPTYHLQQFDTLSSRLEGATRRCYISFVAPYAKTLRNLHRVEREAGMHFRTLPTEGQRSLAKQLSSLASVHSMRLYACCNDHLVGDGVLKGECVGREMIRLINPQVGNRLVLAPTRPQCGCVRSIDIGAYDTCVFGCAYCYATNSRQAALRRLHAHDPSDTLLFRPASLRGVDLSTREEAADHPLSFDTSAGACV